MILCAPLRLQGVVLPASHWNYGGFVDIAGFDGRAQSAHGLNVPYITSYLYWSSHSCMTLAVIQCYKT